jgi:hypothetical protein
LIQSESGEGIFCFPNALVYLVLIKLGTKISVEELKNWLGDEKSIFVQCEEKMLPNSDSLVTCDQNAIGSIHWPL